MAEDYEHWSEMAHRINDVFRQVEEAGTAPGDDTRRHRTNLLTAMYEEALEEIMESAGLPGDMRVHVREVGSRYLELLGAVPLPVPGGMTQSTIQGTWSDFFRDTLESVWTEASLHGLTDEQQEALDAEARKLCSIPADDGGEHYRRRHAAPTRYQER